MEVLQTRILITHINGAIIAYLYNRESFDLLNIQKQEYDNSQFISIGDTIEFDNSKYIVESINFKMENTLHKMNHGYGINLYAPTDPSDFNCQIGVFVKNL